LDRFANLTNISLTQCSGGTLSAAVNNDNQFTTGYTYDAAGNLTNDGVNTYTYNAENELTSSNGETYVYDGNGMRVKKSNSSGGTLYWRSAKGNTLLETNLSGAPVNVYIFFGRRRLVQRNASTLAQYYYQTDQAGTTRSIVQFSSSGTASICYDADYTPYGSEMAHTSGCSVAPTTNLPATNAIPRQAWITR